MLLDGLIGYWELKSALASSRWPPRTLRRWQEDRLRKLLVHAYERVPLYRRLYDGAGFRPQDFHSLADLGKVPVLHKSWLKAAGAEEVLARGVGPDRCNSYSTSGTTGVPLRVYLRAAEERWHRVVGVRILMEHGLRWTDRVLEISFSFGKEVWVQKVGIHRKDWLSLLDSPESWARCFAEKKHEAIVTYATALGALAEAIDALGLETHPPRLIVSVSETLTPATRDLVKRVLGADPIDVFGMVELSNFAWECERRAGFHVSADSHIVEVDALPEEPGPMLVTGLGMWTMPIIRYETGDWAQIDPRPCACGRTLPRFRHLLGRAFDTVILPSGRRLFWNVFFEILSEYDAIAEWRVHQDRRDHLTIQVVLTEDDPDLVGRIAASLRKMINEEVRVSVERVDEIPRIPGKKVRLVTSQVASTA